LHWQEPYIPIILVKPGQQIREEQIPLMPAGEQEEVGVGVAVGFWVGVGRAPPQQMAPDGQVPVAVCQPPLAQSE